MNRRNFFKISGSTVLASYIIPSFKPDVLIIGAGATGCNAAWHLRNAGYSVKVIEASEGPARQASQAAAGFVANWSGIHVPAWGQMQSEMQKYGIDFYSRLAGRSKKDIGFRKCGICYIYTQQDKWEEGQKRIENSRLLGVPCEVLDKERCSEVLPLLEFDAVAGVAYDPTSVRIRAGEAIPFLAQEAINNGVEFHFNTKVRSLIRSGSRITGVRTDKGDFQAGNVLVAAGAWSLKFLNDLGPAPPVDPLIEARYTTQALPGVPDSMPLLIFSDIGFYIREEKGGLLIGGGDGSHSDRQVDYDNIPTSDLLKNHPQIQRISRHLSVIYDALPVLRTAKIEEGAGGIPTFTQDKNFIADKMNDYANLYVITACQEAGVTHGPALGKMMAELITSGVSDIKFKDFRLNRF